MPYGEDIQTRRYLDSFETLVSHKGFFQAIQCMTTKALALIVPILMGQNLTDQEFGALEDRMRS
jgi:hypothetical protein